MLRERRGGEELLDRFCGEVDGFDGAKNDTDYGAATNWYNDEMTWPKGHVGRIS